MTGYYASSHVSVVTSARSSYIAGGDTSQWAEWEGTILRNSSWGISLALSLILLYHTHPSSKIREKRGIFWGNPGFAFSWEKGYFGTHLQCFTVKRGKGFIWAEKSVFYHQKWVFLSWKVSILLQKGDHFETGEQGWVLLFPVSEGAGRISDNQLSYVHAWLEGCMVRREDGRYVDELIKEWIEFNDCR